MLIILTTNITPRLSYAAKQVFERILSLPYHLTDHRNYNPISSDFVVHYHSESLDTGRSIYYSGLCSEKSLKEFRPSVSVKDDKPVYFLNPTASNIYPIDIFSLSLFFLSRYEEYLPSEKDKHNRFIASESLAGINNHLDFPIVDYWVRHFSDYLAQLFPGLNIPTPAFKFIPTFDIDHAWKYKNKGYLRNTGGILKDLKNISVNLLARRFKVLTGITKDPYDTFQEINETHIGLELHYFILLGEYSLVDINIDKNNVAFQNLIKELSNLFEVGIHPSYASNNDLTILNNEVNTLKSIIQKIPVKSRQHFLKLNLPETYQKLISAGITDDYTMGYADEIGFRAGTAYSFDWYDLSQETTTNLMIWPFVAMDITLRDYLNLSPDQAFLKLKYITSTIQQTGGNLITIWHNSSFCNEPDWKDWKNAYTEFILSMKPIS